MQMPVVEAVLSGAAGTVDQAAGQLGTGCNGPKSNQTGTAVVVDDGLPVVLGHVECPSAMAMAAFGSLRTMG